ncbi:MAG: squalene/phytoene synthase family protein [Acidimicrobiaceae bacterium]|nr:squalene/phytoene synthase family protein [Acidimicrobiaceae bacterium]
MISNDDAQKYCQRITWAEARNFAYGIRLLSPDRRRAMTALYAMARRIDDIGDGDWTEKRKQEALQQQHKTIDALERGDISDPNDPILLEVAHAASCFPIPVAALHEIVEGCEQDVSGTDYVTMEDTIEYCRLVAGSVGRLSLGIFGLKKAKHEHSTKEQTNDGDSNVLECSPEKLADDLGVALQLTNILRDIVEDERRGRVYLPEEECERFGVEPGLWKPSEGFSALVESVGGHAIGWFDRGFELLEYLDHRSRACTAAMAGIYKRLLIRILDDPISPLRERVALPAWEKALVAVRSVSGFTP